MSDIEVSILIKSLMLDIKNNEEAFYQSEEFSNLQARMEELEASESTEEVEKEKQELETRANQIHKNFVLSPLKNISQEQMSEILFTITPQFLEENHVFTSRYFNIVIIFLLDNLEDKNCHLHNMLLANENFITAISIPNLITNDLTILNHLVEKTNSEEIMMSFIKDYSQNFKKVPVGTFSVPVNMELGGLIEAVFNTKNYNLTFKESLLSDQELLPYINSFTLEKVITSSDFPKYKKYELLLRKDIFNQMSASRFSKALASLCQSYDDLQVILNNDTIAQKLQIGYLLEQIELSPSESKKLLSNEKIVEKMDLTEFLIYAKIDFETRKELLFDERFLSKLSGLNIAEILTSTQINSEQRKELLLDSRICEMITSSSDSLVELFISYILNSTIPISDKLFLFKEERYRDKIGNIAIKNFLRSPDLPIEVANEILFDKRLFYKLIGEWHEEYNNHPDESPFGINDKRGPYKYDKYEFVKKLYEKNPYIARTLDYDLLKDEILDLGFEFVEKISRYPYLASCLASAYDFGQQPIYLENMIKVISNSPVSSKINIELFVTNLIAINNDNSYYNTNPRKRRKLSKIRHTTHLDPKTFTSQNWKTITEIGLRDMSIYYNDISPYGSKEEIDISLNILPDVETLEDLDNYTERRVRLCDEAFNTAVLNKDLDGAKNAYLNKYFSINIEEAQEIVRMFATSIHEFDDNPSYTMQTKYVEQIMKVLKLEKIATINQSYHDPILEPLSFDETIYIDQSLRQMFSKQMSDSVYKVTDKVLDTNGNLVDNKPQYRDFIIEENDTKIMKKVPVYEPGFDFKMLIHSTAAYRQMELLNDSYFDSWNKSKRIANHGICCSLISNDNMGMAAVNDVLFGFDSWSAKAITKSAPYDLYSTNDDYDIQEGRSLTFMSAQDMVNNTRHTHNEQVLERYEMRDDRRTYERQNIQPSYVIVYSDMADKIKQKAVKCSEEMGIPIVYLDKEKIINQEVNKIDTKINQFYKISNSQNKLALIEKILLSHENNRSGLKATNPDWVEKYFPTSKIDVLFNQLITEIKSKYQQEGNISEYYQYSSQLMDILDRENQKFQVTMETIERKNYIDIPVEKYETEMMQFINPNLCQTNLPKLESIIQTHQREYPDLPLTQALLSVDSSLIHSQIEDMLAKNLYPSEGRNHNIGHIERVLFFSQLIGKNEFTLENGEIDLHAIDLLTQSAKYHDCGRENDTVDNKHGQKSADKMYAMLKQDGYSEEDIKIMQVAVVYHEQADDELRFEKICEKYNIDPSKIAYAKRIANCLKDADALDRTRFKNSNAKLDTNMLRLDSSKELVPIAELLNRSYKDFDRQQFEKTCQYMLYQQMSNQNTEEFIINSTQNIQGGISSAK